MIKEPPIGAVMRVTYQNGNVGVWQHVHIDALGGYDAWERHGYSRSDWAQVIEGAVKVERAVFLGLNLSGRRRVMDDD